MKKMTIGVFPSRDKAEKAINDVHRDLGVNNDDISYLYKNTEGDIREVDADKVSSSTPTEGAKKGAAIGGTIGALAGIAAIAGVIPVVGPLIAAGPLAAALGLGGAIGTTVAGAATGAAAGGIIGALISFGIDQEHAQKYSDRVEAGDVLVSVSADEDKNVEKVLTENGASDVGVFVLNV